jgi:hypothetical protein
VRNGEIKENTLMKYKERKTGRLSRNVDKELPLQPCVISQNSVYPIYFGAEA